MSVLSRYIFLVRCIAWGCLFLLAAVYPRIRAWSVHSGPLSCEGLAVHDRTGVAVCTPLLHVETEERLRKSNAVCTWTDICLPDDLRLDGSLIIGASDWKFRHELQQFGEKKMIPLPLRAEQVHPQQGYTLQEVKDNTVTLLDAEDGVSRRYTFFTLPQNTTAWYSGFSACGKLDILRFEAEAPTDLYEPELAYAIADRADSLPRMYDVYDVCGAAPAWRTKEGVLYRLLLCVIGFVGFFRCRAAWRRHMQDAREN